MGEYAQATLRLIPQIMNLGHVMTKKSERQFTFYIHNQLS